MSEYNTIKELVIDSCVSEGELPSYEKLTSLVLQHFPKSKWQKTHYAWYKSKIKNGEITVPGFSDSSENEITRDSSEDEVFDTVEASLSMERDLHAYYSAHVAKIESGLILVENGIEYQIDAGRIDLLAKDSHGNLVVIELKAGKARDNALGQLLGYMGCVSSESNNDKTEIRGILVASDFDKRVIYAAKGLPKVKLIKYKVSFDLEEII